MKKCLFDQERNEARESAIALASRTFGLEIWVIAAVILAEVLKNIFYEPIVLGGAVKLHALVVVIGVVGGGGMLFDLAGVLPAIPVITVFKVFVSSTAMQLEAYGLI